MKGDIRVLGEGFQAPSWGLEIRISWDIVPENRIGGGSDLLSLPGREGSQEGVQLVREQPGRGKTLRPLPEIQMPEDPVDDSRLVDAGDNLHPGATLAASQGIDFIDLLKQPRPAATELGGETFGL